MPQGLMKHFVLELSLVSHGPHQKDLRPNDLSIDKELQSLSYDLGK